MLTVTTRVAATSLLLIPSATRTATRSSVGVSSPDDAARPPMRVSSPRAWIAQSTAPRSSKIASARPSVSRAARR